MKSDKYVQSLNVIDPDENTQERMLRQILSRKYIAKTQSKANNYTRITVKRLAPVAACVILFAVVMTNYSYLFNNPTLVVDPLQNGEQFTPYPTQSEEQNTNNPTEKGVIIIGDKKDDFGDNVDEETIERTPIFISPMLQEAINSAKPGDTIKTVVRVPGFHDFLDAFEINGVIYGELEEYYQSGEWKNNFDKFLETPESKEYIQKTEEKLAHLREQAALAFYEKKVAELEIENVEPFSYEYSRVYHYCTFTAVLSPDKIFSLKKEKCFMWLWSAAGYYEQFEQPVDLNE